MKKFLALVLAMMMTLSLMVTANAANKEFDDGETITDTFLEDITVLAGMGVFEGYSDGTFKPTDTVTRAEMAAIVYRLVTGDVEGDSDALHAHYGSFKDVADDKWYAGYVGYCANAGLIKGYGDGTFRPSNKVTGYEALVMLLRAIGYDQPNEFSKSDWRTHAASIATTRGLLTKVNATRYQGTLSQAALREVVAEISFQAARATRVVYTPAFGYQTGDHTSSAVTDLYDDYDPLGWVNFGLYSSTAMVIGNQQTGETNTRLGKGGVVEEDVNGVKIAPYRFSDYTWEGSYSKTDVTDYLGANGAAQTNQAHTLALGDNDIFNVETGIDLFGHKVTMWYDARSFMMDPIKGHPVYAHFDRAKTEVVYADNTILNAAGTAPTINLADAIGGTDLSVNASETAVFSNSFSKFGTLDGSTPPVSTGDGANTVGNGATPGNQYASPVKLYKIISNNPYNTVDAVIALNIESSRITESNTVNRVPTLGMPVENRGGDAANTQYGDLYVMGNKGNVNASTPDVNLKMVGSTVTGVLAQDALVGNSTKTLGDYEMGIHITGTTPRIVSTAEHDAINYRGVEDSFYLLNKVEATVEGTVVAYDTVKGTVTLDNGTVLERSKFYHTVVNWADGATGATAPASVIPQAWMKVGTTWVEGYANAGYKFYTDYEGKYLGAERTYGSTFLYGTYLDYSQETSSSTFKYYLTGVTLDGEIKTMPVEKYWSAATTLSDITGTQQLDTPFRDNTGAAAGTNTIAEGEYQGFAILGTYADEIDNDPGTDKNEYLNNMARLGVKHASVGAGFTADIVVDRDSVTLGAEETVANTSNKYLTEGTKFILVSGFGTDSVKAEVYEGISELRGNASKVTIEMAGSNVPLKSGWTGVAGNVMTYYTESPYTYAQSGSTAMKIDTIILAKEQVTWSGGSGLYYVGDPTPILVNSWGTDAWKYNLYLDGELKQVWLTNEPGNAGTVGLADPYADKALAADRFVQLKDTGLKANDGEPIYTAGAYVLSTGAWIAGGGNAGVTDGAAGDGNYLTNGATANLLPANPGVEYLTGAVYSAMTRDAQTATFTATTGKLLRVADAKVVNLNAKDNWRTEPASKEIWPNITDLTTLNEAGSISPVTGRALKVAAVVDANNPLNVTCIYVCWDQT